MVLSSEETWQATLAQLQLQMTKATFDTWIRDTQVVDCENNTFVIGVKNDYAKDWLENRLLGTIKRALGNIAGRSVRIEFIVLPGSDTLEPGRANPSMNAKRNGAFVNGASHKKSGAAMNSDIRVSPNGGFSIGEAMKLSNNYTFDRFVVGPSNQLAHAASRAVSERPGEAYNPLFLYGGVGLGKTHLLQAVAHEALQVNKTVIYVSSETFTNDFINALRHNSTDAFREHYRNAHFLLVDDIQFIAGKESTQEEFFHTFNDIHSMGGQIVLTSDRVPKAIPTLQDRLSSRFEWGLSADLQPPDLETRMAILRFKSDGISVSVPQDVMEFIARRCQNNIRELEGALNKVIAHAALNQAPISLEQAQYALQDLVSRQASITIDMVIEAVTEYYSVSGDDIRGVSRSKRVSGPRQMVMYLTREETKSSLPQIGESLGGRDHTTIMYGCDKVTRLIEENETVRRDAMKIREILYQKVS
jgi:chromosomal replication initiator protein